EARGLFAVERGGQKLRGFQEATPAFRPGVACIAVGHRQGGELPLVQCVRREDNTARLVEARLPGWEPRRQGPWRVGDEVGGPRPKAWASALPRVRRRGDGAVGENRALPASPHPRPAVP